MSESKKTINQKSVEQVEQERLTRRTALRKLGFGAGLSAFMLLGVDDLARMVGTKMVQTAHDNKTAEQIAREFQSAGVAMADTSASGTGGGVNPACQKCMDTKSVQKNACTGALNACIDYTNTGHGNAEDCTNAYPACLAGATCIAADCLKQNGCTNI